MTNNNLKLVTTDAEPATDPEATATDPARDRLRQAVELQARADTKRAKCAAALDRGRQHVEAAEAKIDAANKLVDRAVEHAAKTTAAALRGGSRVSDEAGPLRRARAKATEASDDLLAAQGALARLEADAADAADERLVVERSLNAAVAAVLGPAAEQLCEHVEHLADLQRGQRGALFFLRYGPLLTAIDLDQWSTLKSRIDFSLYGVQRLDDRAIKHVQVAEWRAGVEALRHDPRASLPK